MPPKNKPCFIATYEEFYGIGSTLKLALADLRSNGPSGIETEEVDFYESILLDVEIQLVIISDEN